MARWSACSCVSCPAHPGSCPELTTARRCAVCTSTREQQRGTRQARGYGAQHDAIRADLLRKLTPGLACPKCGKPMWQWQKLDAGHSTDLRDNPDAAADQLEHRGCNRAWRRGQTSRTVTNPGG